MNLFSETHMKEFTELESHPFYKCTNFKRIPLFSFYALDSMGVRRETEKPTGISLKYIY